MDKPVIAITALFDSKKDSYWMLPGYMKGVETAGGIPIMLPLTTDADIIHTIAERCDGFLFTGGQDISPTRYGEKPIPECGEICTQRDEMEQILLNKVLRLDKPILGICRGIQFLNAALGGTLYQDLPTEFLSTLEHHQSPPYDVPIHHVQLVAETPLQKLLCCETLSVNSYHHQAVKELSAQLIPMAYAEDGIVEAVYMPDKHFVWAVQWHPEFSFASDENSRKIFKVFVSAAAAN